MDKKTGRSGWMLSSSLVFALALTVGMFTGAVANGADMLYYWTGDDSLNDNWGNAGNWEVDGSSVENAPDLGDNTYMNKAGETIEMDTDIDASSNRTGFIINPNNDSENSAADTDAVNFNINSDITVNQHSHDWRMAWGDNSGDTIYTNANANIKDGASLSLGQLYRTGSGSHNATATINVESGGTFVSRGNMTNYLASGYGDDTGNGGTGVLTIESGARATFQSGGSLALNRNDGGTARIKVAGGDLDIAASLNSSNGASEYIVEGTGRNFDDTGSNTINIGGNFNVLNAKHADDFVRLLTDDGGVTTTEIGGNFRVADGAVLDLGFLDPSNQQGGTWRAFEWDGDLVDGAGDSIDAATAEDYLTLTSSNGDVSDYSFDIVDTTNSGYMTVSVPEPSTLALLGLAGLLLMKPRRRRA